MTEDPNVLQHREQVDARLESMEGVPAALTLPDRCDELDDHLSVSAQGVVHLGGPWAHSMKLVARGLVVLAFLLLLMVAIARVMDLGWTPRYVSLVALAVGVLIIFSPMGARPRSPSETGIELRSGEAFVRVSGRGRSKDEIFPLRSIRRISLEGVCNEFLRRDGDMQVARRGRRRAIAELRRRGERLAEKSPNDACSHDIFSTELQGMEFERVGLVAELEDGREVLVASQHCDTAIERLLALATLLIDHYPGLDRQITVTPSSVVKLPKNKDGAFTGPGHWTFGPGGSGWLAIGMLSSVLVTTAFWLWALPRPFFGTPQTPAWLLGIYTAAPFFTLAPLAMAMITDRVRPPEIQVAQTSDDGRFWELVVLTLLTGLALCAYLGLRDVPIGVPGWAQVVAGVLLVLVIIIKPLRGLVVLVAGSVGYVVSKGFGRAFRWHDGAYIDEAPLVQAWEALLSWLAGVAAFAVCLVFIFGLGKVSGTLMGVEPAGGGGKTAIPLYFDILVVTVMLAWLPYQYRNHPAWRWVLMVAVILLFSWLIFESSIPGMSHLNPLVITIYLTLNTLVAHHLFR